MNIYEVVNSFGLFGWISYFCCVAIAITLVVATYRRNKKNDR